MKRSLGALLSAAMLAGSFLCLGMGMDMGTAYAQEPAHHCCPGNAPEKKADSAPSCCLLMPAALSSSVAAPAPLLLGVLAASLSETAVTASVPSRLEGLGPPGSASPGHASPASPRAPPAA